jgi:hypothetical protein
MSSALQRHNTENSKQIFPEQELCGLSSLRDVGQTNEQQSNFNEKLISELHALQRGNTENAKQIFPEKELCGLRVPISTFMGLSAIYIFP